MTTAEELAGEVSAEVIPLKNPVVVILRGKNMHPEFGRVFTEQLQPLLEGREDEVLIVTAKPGYSIEVLDEEAMRELGWVRADE